MHIYIRSRFYFVAQISDKLFELTHHDPMSSRAEKVLWRLFSVQLYYSAAG